MAVFEQLVEKTIECVEKWHCKDRVNEVTIIRDVTGRIALLISTKLEISQSEIEGLSELLKNELHQYYRNNIYCKQNKNSDLIEKMIEEIEKNRWLYDDSKNVSYFLLERAIAKKAWVECNGLEKSIWPYDEAVRGKKPKVVTFYSFKGGMGRTTALAATALILAKEGKNVLMIDTDIEAPGLPSLFLNEDKVQKGVIDYLLEATVTPENGSIDMKEMIHQVTDPQLMKDIVGKMFIVPSGAMDINYLQKLARIDYQDAIPGNMKKQLMRLVNNAISVIQNICSVDFVLLDARAGFHDMGGIITIQIPHGVVLFGKDSIQSWQGMNLVVQAIGASQQERPFIAMVDSVCGTAGSVSPEEKESFKSQAYTICCSSYYMEDEEQPGIDAQDVAHTPIFVPYQTLLSRDVQLFTDGTQQMDEKINEIRQIMLGEPYQKIAKRIAQWYETEGVENE